jgi:hypothetical protein
MKISGTGWEMLIVRKLEQKRVHDGRRRTVGTYQVFHDGVAQSGADMSGMVAETKGPGANKPENNGRRIEQGSYQLATQDGGHYVTFGFVDDDDPDSVPKPGIELTGTGKRTEILFHPGHDFLSSVGCINPCTSLPNASEMISYVGSRRRVLAVIADMKAFTKTRFPRTNGKKIPGAFIVIDGEPS